MKKTIRFGFSKASAFSIWNADASLQREGFCAIATGGSIGYDGEEAPDSLSNCRIIL